MTEQGDGSRGPSTPITRNDAGGVVSGSLVQAHSITGDVTVASSAREEASAVDEWAEGLAQGVRKKWRYEERHRRLHDPAPLPVRWHLGPAELRDQWTNVLRLPVGTSGEPLHLDGRIEQLRETYRSVPSGRLVFLGPAGAGKTVLASRLALDLLEDLPPGGPVPVIVSVGSWNPETTSLKVWLTGQLTRDHPGLATRARPGGPSRAEALIDAGRVLPVLDGFDEIQPGLHKHALDQLNADPAAPLVVTSRVAEYAVAVHDVDVLKSAAVVELDALTVEDLAGYLPRTTAGRHTGKWAPVLERMRAETHDRGPATLCEVLTNPLMVFLARTVYSDVPGNDPGELLDVRRFPTADALRDHLLANFVPAVYRADQPERPPRWPAKRAHRYLTHLVGHLRRGGTTDVAWWRLRDTIPRWKRTLIFAVLDGLLAALLGGFAMFTEGRLRAPNLLLEMLVTAVASGLTVALTVGLTSRLRIGSRFLVALVTGLGTVLVCGLPSVLVDELLPAAGKLMPELTLALVLGIIAATAAGHIGLRGAGPQPARVRLQVRGRGRAFVRTFVLWLLVWLLFVLESALVDEVRDHTPGPGTAFSALFWGVSALLILLVWCLASRHPAGPVLWAVCLAGLIVLWVWGRSIEAWDPHRLLLMAGLAPVVGLAAVLVSLAFELEVPMRPADVVSASESLAQDRLNTVRKVLSVGLPVGLLYGLLVNEAGLAWGFAYGALAGVLSVRATSAWLYWLVLVRGWLPLTGSLPWSVQAFLTDACRRGVLRQTGAVYQFRHARLHAHLSGDSPTPVSAPVSAPAER